MQREAHGRASTGWRGTTLLFFVSLSSSALPAARRCVWWWMRFTPPRPLALDPRPPGERRNHALQWGRRAWTTLAAGLGCHSDRPSSLARNVHHLVVVVVFPTVSPTVSDTHRDATQRDGDSIRLCARPARRQAHLGIYVRNRVDKRLGCVQDRLISDREAGGASQSTAPRSKVHVVYA